MPAQCTCMHRMVLTVNTDTSLSHFNWLGFQWDKLCSLRGTNWMSPKPFVQLNSCAIHASNEKPGFDGWRVCVRIVFDWASTSTSSLPTTLHHCSIFLFIRSTSWWWQGTCQQRSPILDSGEHWTGQYFNIYASKGLTLSQLFLPVTYWQSVNIISYLHHFEMSLQMISYTAGNYL